MGSSLIESHSASRRPTTRRLSGRRGPSLAWLDLERESLRRPGAQLLALRAGASSRSWPRLCWGGECGACTVPQLCLHPAHFSPSHTAGSAVAGVIRIALLVHALPRASEDATT